MIREASAFLRDFHWHDVLVSSGHSPAMARHRVATLSTRVRLVAGGFSVLTLAWALIDFITLDMETFAAMLVLRIAAAGMFLWLAYYDEARPDKTKALFRLSIMLLVPLSIFVFSRMMFGDVAASGLAALNMRLYDALPYIVLAGLSIFPLVAIEGFLLGLMVLILSGLGAAQAADATWTQVLSLTWTLFLGLGVFLIAQMVQLTYMRALLGHANHDPLTNALTRRSGGEMMDFAFRIATEKDAPLAVAFLDLDSFKSINDIFGHEVGDDALKMLVANLHNHSRRGDEVIRWGGEEFVFLLADANVDGATIVINRIMTDWLGTRPEGGPLTASIGFAERLADGIDDWEDLITLADQRMYEAKQSGKARCVGPNGLVLLPPGVGSAGKG